MCWGLCTLSHLAAVSSDEYDHLSLFACCHVCLYFCAHVCVRAAALIYILMVGKERLGVMEGVAD